MQQKETTRHFYDTSDQRRFGEERRKHTEKDHIGADNQHGSSAGSDSRSERGRQGLLYKTDVGGF